MKVKRLGSLLLVGALLLSTYSGCSSLGGKLADSDGRFNLLKRFGSDKKEEPEFQIPKSMVGIWKPSTYEKAGSKSIRGFGGRFYFYDAKNEPVRVDGDLTIYGYDDHKQAESGESKADRKFVFKADSLNSHYSESAFGDSYSFFVPWDNVGGEQKTITLIPVFKTVDGHMPEAKPATMRLPGRRASKSAAADAEPASQQGAVVQASATLPSALPLGSTITSPIPRKKRARRMPTTLRLTPHLAEHFSTPVQPTDNRSFTQATDSFEEPKSGSVSETSVSIENADEKVNQTSEFGRNPPKAIGKVFGQPGAFR